MSVFSAYLPEWENLYNRICSYALGNVDEANENEVEEIRRDFLKCYNLFAAFGFEEIEAAAFMLVALCSVGSYVINEVTSLQEIRGKKTKYPDYALVSVLGNIFLKDEENRAGLLLRDDSMLNTYFVMNAKGETIDVTMDMPLILCPGLPAFILGEDFSLGEAKKVAKFYYEDDIDDIVAREGEILDLVTVFTNMNATREKGIILLKGNEGIGKAYMAKAIGKSLQMSVGIVDVKKLFSFDGPLIDVMLKKIMQKAFLESGFIYLDFGNSEYIDAKDLQRLFAVLQNNWGVVVAGAISNILDNVAINGQLHIVEVPVPNRHDQIKYWEAFAKSMGARLSEDIKLPELVSTFDLTPGRIKRALICARDLATFERGAFTVNKEVLINEIRKICAGKFSELATRLNTPFTWDDLMVSEKTKGLMTEAVNRVKYKSIVNEEYGFAKKLPYGQGLSVAFYGPPGTGKTMAATVMAKELGLDIYRIDLSQISSKYIGESEKNLSAVFDNAKYSNAILFFDEADALFARRTDVASSNDKHANSETAYLLQKMEEYSGICILATNVIQNFDAAFKRRITYMIPIEKPTEAERVALWENVFPEGTPLADDIDFKKYASASELSGAEIKLSALRAAYLAASQGRAVTHFDIATAIDEEYKKTGHISILPQLMGGIL